MNSEQGRECFLQTCKNAGGRPFPAYHFFHIGEYTKAENASYALLWSPGVQPNSGTLTLRSTTCGGRELEADECNAFYAARALGLREEEFVVYSATTALTCVLPPNMPPLLQLISQLWYSFDSHMRAGSKALQSIVTTEAGGFEMVLQQYCSDPETRRYILEWAELVGLDLQIDCSDPNALPRTYTITPVDPNEED